METFSSQQHPIKSLEQWLEQAKHTELRNPSAFVLSTVDSTGHPSSRVLLVKEVVPEGIVFYTNYSSRKGREITDNPAVAANFYWDVLGRQICMRGSLEKVPREQSIAYWETRPRDSQVAQYVSNQSEPVESRERLEQLFKEAEQRMTNQTVPCPDTWGGYILRATEIEFWLADPRRFHDRFHYRETNGEWKCQRLCP
ncbi:MAG: pyridoxamine 5'-phosphate oxidase [Pseudomonadales bacterium]